LQGVKREYEAAVKSAENAQCRFLVYLQGLKNILHLSSTNNHDVVDFARDDGSSALMTAPGQLVGTGVVDDEQIEENISQGEAQCGNLGKHSKRDFEVQAAVLQKHLLKTLGHNALHEALRCAAVHVSGTLSALEAHEALSAGHLSAVIESLPGDLRLPAQRCLQVRQPPTSAFMSYRRTRLARGRLLAQAGTYIYHRE
jgi:hypothetical protein